MQKEQLEKIIDKLEQTKDRVDSAFDLLIANHISTNDFIKIMNHFNYQLPSDFEQYPSMLQRKYRMHKIIKIVLKDEEDEFYEKEIFNHIYFYDLIEASKRSKTKTEQLIEYVAKLDLMPLYVIAMKYIKLKNINYFLQHKNWVDFANKNKINTLFSFYLSLISSNLTKEEKVILEQFKIYLKKENGFNLDLDLPFVKFTFLMEQLLSSLDEKVANTIKIKFLVYKKEYLRTNEYNSDLINPRNLIKRNKDLFIKRYVDYITRYYNQNEQELDSFNDNGYRAIYYSILESN